MFTFWKIRLQLGANGVLLNLITIRDSDFGTVRLRAFGMYSYKLTDAQKFYTSITGANSTYTAEQLEPQLRNLIVANISTAMASSGCHFDMAANQGLMADKIKEVLKTVILLTIWFRARQLCCGKCLYPKNCKSHRYPHFDGHDGRFKQNTQYQTAKCDSFSRTK